MLQIKNISKQYKTGDLVQNALNDVSLNFRDSEFVSILGPSGSGKTTLLNIIGGLDRYDSGDLIINNVSTKNYKDRDWDSYRNHTIGFVFQSYNLIPHQTVLANVELALTIGGISKKERRNRAMEALAKVGLEGQAHKRPNQMSGGQMQRVAIARALVNNPDILLADEPTGALDTETSVQVMELLKEVAHDRLVIMVTHNPELAEEYSTRIVRLKDGQIIDDTDAFEPNKAEVVPPQHRNLGKASMSFVTALSLSLNNLMTKKARTLLTAFAGSIGIIGIALILSLSTGFQNYINQIQEDTLTSYPLSVYSETADVTSALLSMASGSGEKKDSDIVEEQQYISSMFSSVGTNDLKSFKAYLEDHEEEVEDLTSLVQYGYGVSPMVYTTDCNDEITQLNPSKLLSSLTGTSSTMAMMQGSSSSVFYEMVDDEETLEDQYDVLAGRWPTTYNEAIIVLSEPNGITDLLVYSLGLRDDDELKNMITKLMAGEEVEESKEALEFTYEDLMNIPMKIVDASATYRYNTDYNIYEDMSGDEEYMKDIYDNALDLHIVGVVCAKKGSNAMTLTTGVAYTKELTRYVMNKASESELVKKQLENKDVNVFSGKRFDEESEDSGLDFSEMISIDSDALASAFNVNISEQQVAATTQGAIGNISESITADTSGAKNDFDSTFVTLLNDMLTTYVNNSATDIMTENGTVKGAMIKLSDVDGLVNSYMQSDNYKTLLASLEYKYVVPADVYSTVFEKLMKGSLQGYVSGTGVAMDPNSSEVTSILTQEIVATFVGEIVKQDAFVVASEEMATAMTEAVMQKKILTEVGNLSSTLMGSLANALSVDQTKIAAAFDFGLDEEELTRLMEAMSTSGVEASANTNLLTLGYQDEEEPTSISFYFRDFDAKEEFIDFLDSYNEDMEKTDEDKVISYTDLTGVLMSSVSVIVDSVTYVLIAFVSISLVVSSIMIGIITYISVLERTKEIGVLRAIGASKKNISSIFNAETFIVGLFSGLLGIGVTLSLVPLINHVIHSVTNNYNINAVLPLQGGITLVVLSVVLTLISGLIPSKQAAKKDPVLALRSE